MVYIFYDAIIAFVLLFNVFAMSYLLYSVKRPTNVEEDATEEVESDEYVPFGSEEVLEVNRSFDARIHAMKSEMGMMQSDEPRLGTEAIEMHPLVKNLPHDSVVIPTKVEHEYAN